jgi:uncharacterized protein (UPF0218 family)
MTVAYSITSELRAKLKKPFGVLVRGSFSETVNKLKAMVAAEQPPLIISVGDTVSRNLHGCGMSPQLSITDCRVMRKSVEPASFEGKKTVCVKNPQGAITEEAILAVRKALRSNEGVHLLVEGEEDLLTLVAVFYSPENSLVVYGQPHEGVVVVKATPEKKAEAAEILGAMAVRKAK